MCAKLRIQAAMLQHMQKIYQYVFKVYKKW